MDFEELERKSFFFKNTPLPGYSINTILQLLAQNRFHISPRYQPRFLYSLLLSSIMLPFRINERIKYDKKIWNTRINKDPVFIIGHWRSGTTYVHNLLSQDPQFGFFSTFQAYLPGIFLDGEKILKPLVNSSIPQKRPMDNVAMNADFPQEDQYALGAFTPYSYYHGWCFPHQMELYNQYVLMNNVSQKDIIKWKQHYLYLLKKATFACQGKQLLLKNQDNTAKIRYLRELFPNAKFLLIQRNPYQMYFSMVKFMRIVIPLYCVQHPPSFSQVEESMLSLYKNMFENYFKQRDKIPDGNLIEIKYEDFIAHPLENIKKVYYALNLSGYAAAEENFKAYLSTQQNVKPSSYSVSDDVRKKIDSYWGFVVNAFDY